MTNNKNDDLLPINFQHSLKNIPISNKSSYLTKLYDQTANFINRMRWKAFFFDKQDPDNADQTNDELSGIFKGKRSAPEIDALKPFENDLYEMLLNIKFTNFKSRFQIKLSNDIKDLLSKKMIIINSDKTSNLYYAKPDFYNKLMKNNISSKYSIDTTDPINLINNEAALILSHSNTKNRKIPKYQKADAFLTIKDHKPNFPYSISCRTINPSKTHLGKWSKVILQKHLSGIRNNCNLTQWKNSTEVIEWFNLIEDKTHKCFINFDIKNFYPSIKRKHLLNAIKFSSKFSKFTDQEVGLIMHTCKSVLCYDNKVWKKSGDDTNFDIPMGSFHGAEICDLIGLYILNEITPVIGPNCIGLYRDDGLGILQQTSGSHIERMKKTILKKISNIGFEITIDIGSTATDFLDVHLDLASNNYHPYHKPNSKTLYINNGSNHPKRIRENIPIMIEKRISGLTKNIESFNTNKHIYQNALNKSNFKYHLKYNPAANSKTKTRKRKCIYFNPPFCQSVQTNIGKIFLKLIDKHFPEHHDYRKIFNRKCVKISYSCSPNVKALISSHNKKLLNKPTTSTTLCNCRNKTNCPVNNKCLTKNIIYEAKITPANGNPMTYIGSTRRSFKIRFNEHKNTFPKTNKPKPLQCTQLANYLWELYQKNIEYNINWKILKNTNSKFKPLKMCTLCNLERMYIAAADKRKILNKRNELVTKCQHYPKEFF